MNFEELKAAVLNRTARPGWASGVLAYAEDLLDSLEGTLKYNEDALTNSTLLRKAMLKGAKNWSQYSYGGCSLIYDGDIAERVCTPKAYERCRGGELSPGRGKTWLDVQAKALEQAARLIIKTYIDIKSSTLDSKEW